jgi:hypothetical protein
MKTMLAAALAVVGLAATGQAASAAPAYWNVANGTAVTMKGNLTMVRYGQTFTCTNFTWNVTVSNVGASGPGEVGNLAYNTCTRAGVNSTIVTNPTGLSVVNGGVYSLVIRGTNLGFPALGGMYVQTTSVVPFINGSGTPPSRLAFNNTHIGDGIFVTGTLDVKVFATGGLVTLT